MKKLLGSSFLLLIYLYLVSADEKGVDMSTRVYSSAFECLKNDGYTFAIIRGYQSLGQVDANCVANIASAWEGGMQHVDVYLFPRYSSGDPEKQISDLATALSDSKYGMIWIDIEGKTYWSSNKADNNAFVTSMIHKGKELGLRLGIYSNQYQWGEVMGSESTVGADLDIWYAHYDSVDSYTDWSSGYDFGGWKDVQPSMKQYVGDTVVCSTGVDLNWISEEPKGWKPLSSSSIRDSPLLFAFPILLYFFLC